MKNEKLAQDEMITAMQNPQTVEGIRRINSEMIKRQRQAQAAIAKNKLEASSRYISNPRRKKPTLETLIIVVVVSCIALAGKVWLS